MARDGGKMTYSRVKKYQELRDGLKEEVGISKEKAQESKLSLARSTCMC